MTAPAPPTFLAAAFAPGPPSTRTETGDPHHRSAAPRALDEVWSSASVAESVGTLRGR